METEYRYYRHIGSTFEINRLSDLFDWRSADIIIIQGEKETIVKFTTDDIKRCSAMVRELNSTTDSEYSFEGGSPKTIGDCIAAINCDPDSTLGVLRLILLVHSKSQYRYMLDDKLVESIMEYLMHSWDITLRIADYLRINEITNYILMHHDAQEFEMDFIVYNHTLDRRQIVDCMSRGLLVEFDGVIDKIWDIAAFERALDLGMRVIKIEDGSHLTNEFLAKCVHLEVLNVDSNSYVTELGECAKSLIELHCCNSSGIQQDQIDLCVNLKCLFADNNPYIIECNVDKIETLSIRGTCGIMNDFLERCPKLQELYVDVKHTVTGLPRRITKLHILEEDWFGKTKDNFSPDNRNLEYLEVRHDWMIDKVGPKLKTLICHDSSVSAVESRLGSIIVDAINLETLIAPNEYVRVNMMPNLKHLELKCVMLSDIANPSILEVLKAEEFIGSPDSKKIEYTFHNYDSDGDSDDDTYLVDQNMYMYYLNAFTKLHTLHVGNRLHLQPWGSIERNVIVKVSEGCPLRDIGCHKLVGSMSRLERLVAVYHPTERWSVKQKSSIEYLETQHLPKHFERDYSGIKEFKFIGREYFRFHSILRDVMHEGKYELIRHINPHRAFDDSFKNLMILLNMTLYSHALHPEIFSNIRVLKVRPREYFELHCKHLPMLTDLSIEEGGRQAVVLGLEKLTKLENIRIDLECLIRRVEGYRPSYEDAEESRAIELPHGIRIFNPLLKSMEIESIGTENLNELVIDSIWLKNLTIRRRPDAGTTIIRLLTLSTPYLERLSIERCAKIKIIDHDQFKSLVRYKGDILIDFEGSVRTLQQIMLPRGREVDVSHLDRYKSKQLELVLDVHSWFIYGAKGSSDREGELNESDEDIICSDSDDPRPMARSKSVAHTRRKSKYADSDDNPPKPRAAGTDRPRRKIDSSSDDDKYKRTKPGPKKRFDSSDSD